MTKTRITIDPEFEALIPPLAPAELAALRESIEREGVHSTLQVWRHGGCDILIDGHHRYRIACELGIEDSLRVFRLPCRDREDAKTWMLKHQAARRSLSREQLLVLAVSRGLAPDTNANSDAEIEAARAVHAAGLSDDVLAGRLSFRQARNRIAPHRPQRAPRGPQTKPHAIPEGHELAGLSTLTGPEGEEKATWAKTRIAGADEPPVAVPENFVPRRVSTMRRGDGTTVIQWESREPEKEARDAAILEAWQRHADLYRGIADVVPAPSGALSTDLLTVYPLGDPHIGMLAWAPETGENFDTAIACRELLACVREMVAGAPPAREALIVNLGDALHAQDDMQRTPGHGNKLDVDGRFAKVLDAAHTVFRGIVESALCKHEIVRFRNLPGNHDPRVAAELSMWLRAVFENNPRVIIEDAFALHQYDRFGKVLIGWHHGDATPANELPAIMATDRPEDWGATFFRVWHCGHVHHLSRKESPGVTVETHRTIAAKDAWHAGRYRAGRSLQAITYHKDYGEDSRVTVGLERVRARLAART